MSDIHDLSGLDQAKAIRAGQLSPVDVVTHYLDRVGRLSAELGAFITVTPDQAIAEARAAAELLAAGAAAREDLPRLFGVPTAIKDTIPTAGIRTTLGSQAFTNYVPDTDAHAVSLLRAAGTISLGKTNVPEFAFACFTDNDITGPARCPFDPRCNAGGSSGGAAAAVAAGLIPFAHGTDGGGSLRIPGSFCGLVGLKPSRGRVSAGPVAADAPGLSTHGPLARTVRDAAAMLDALAVPMPGDPYWAPPLLAGETFLQYADRDPGRLRIGRYRTAPDGVVPEPECIAAYEDVSALLSSLGHEVEDIEPPFSRCMSSYSEAVWSVHALDYQVDAADEMLLRPITRIWRDRGRPVTGSKYTAAMNALQIEARKSVVATAAYDIVLTPTLAKPPQPVEYFSEEDPLENLRRQDSVIPFSGICNMTGQPAVSLPVYWTADGVPIGISLTGRPAGEGTLISLSSQVEAARPWADRKPPCW